MVTQPIYAKPSLSDPVGRIARMRERYQTGPAVISIERARYYTESWAATEGKGIALPVRVALAMKNVYENMTIYLDPDDRIAVCRIWSVKGCSGSS